MKSEAYEKFLDNVRVFRELDALPENVPFTSEAVDSLIAIEAMWHKSYHSKSTIKNSNEF